MGIKPRIPECDVSVLPPTLKDLVSELTLGLLWMEWGGSVRLLEPSLVASQDLQDQQAGVLSHSPDTPWLSTTEYGPLTPLADICPQLNFKEKSSHGVQKVNI